MLVVFSSFILLYLLLLLSSQVECYVNVTVGNPNSKPTDLYNASLIQTAISNAPIGLTSPYVILIYPGTYYGQIIVDRPFLTLTGTGMNETIITWDHCSLPIFESASALLVTEAGNDTNIEYMKLANTFADPYVLGPHPSPPPANTTEVAVTVTVYAERIAFRNVYIYGWQDTYLTNRGTQYIANSIIRGRTDYIFGQGTSYIENTQLFSYPGGFITAASTLPSSIYGLVFQSCTIVYTNYNYTGKDAAIDLGRAWHNVPMVTYIDTIMPTDISLINNQPWISMGIEDSDVCMTRFAEYHSIFANNDTSYTITHPQSCKSNPNLIIAQVNLPTNLTEFYSKITVLGGWNPNQDSFITEKERNNYLGLNNI